MENNDKGESERQTIKNGSIKENENLVNNNDKTGKDKDNDKDKNKEKPKGENEKEEKKFIGQGKPVGIFELYFKYATKWDVFFIILAMIGSIGSGLSMPLFSLLFGDALVDLGPKNSSKESFEQLIYDMLIQFIIVACAMFAAYAMNSGFWVYTSMRNLSCLKKEYFKVIMNQEQGWFDKNNPYEFSTMVQTQIKTIERGLGDKLGYVLLAVSMFISGLIISFMTSWKLSLVLIAMMPFMAIGGAIFTQALMEGTRTSNELYTKAGGVSEEVLYQIKTVASFANFDYEMNKYDNYVKICRDISTKNSLKAALGIGLLWFVLFASYAMAIWYGSTLIIDGDINSTTGKPFSGGDVMTVMFSVIFAGMALGQAEPNFKAINDARIAASDFFELSRRVKEIDLSRSTKKPDRDQIKGEIQLKDLKFCYPKDPNKEVLKGINFTFPTKKKVAIVGESGSGKSTIVNLLERLYDSTSGEILIDGIDIKEYDLPYLRSCIGFVQQEPVLFNKSIRENVIFGRENISDDMIKEALRESLADEFINDIKEGLDFRVGIKGKNLSGGQKQRIAIARAILNKPKILILDEATSALDNNNERLVQISLDRVSKDVTTVVIAHRLSTIINADIIIAMKEGEIQEIGSHDELLNKKGYYHALFNSQTDKNSSEEKVEENNDKLNLNKFNDVKSKKSTQNKAENKEEVELDEEQKKLKEKEIDERYKKSSSKLFYYLKDNKCLMVSAGISAAINGTIFPIYGLVLAYAIDFISSPDPQIVKDQGFFIAMMFLVIAVGSGLAVFFQHYLFCKIGEYLCQSLRSATFKKYLQMHMGFFDIPDNAPGSLITALSSDTTKISGVVLTMIGVSVQSIVNLIIGVILGFIYDWRLSLIVLGFMPFIAISGVIEQEIQTGLIKSDENIDNESGAILSESVINTKTIFSFNMEEKICEFYGEIIDRRTSKIIRKAITTGIASGFSQFIIFISFAVLFYVGGLFILDNTLTFGDMIKGIFSILFAAFGLGQAQQYAGDISKARLAINSLFKTLDAESTINPLDESEKTKKDASNISGKIEFRNVTFSYPTRNDTVVLKNINFVILPGQNVAFTGFSGSGKSTIIQLCERFYDVQEGEILIDDVNIKDYQISSLRKKIGIVMQEPNIFKRNIKENIEYGKLGSDYDDIVSSAEKAMIGEFFKDGQKGEKDENVSGGQKQRVSIARAVLKNPRILLLDEATSALDKNSETEVQKAIENASQNRTTITVAHRLSTIQNCDVIFVLNQGEIVEKGKHSELISRDGYYAKQYNVSK